MSKLVYENFRHMLLREQGEKGFFVSNDLALFNSVLLARAQERPQEAIQHDAQFVCLLKHPGASGQFFELLVIRRSAMLPAVLFATTATTAPYSRNGNGTAMARMDDHSHRSSVPPQLNTSVEKACYMAHVPGGRLRKDLS